VTEKPNCYTCKYRGMIPGDAHSRCLHPAIKCDDNPIAAMVEMMQGKTQKAAQQLGIRGHEQGIRRGWFAWPANFDPVWLSACNGFTPMEAKDEE